MQRLRRLLIVLAVLSGLVMTACATGRTVTVDERADGQQIAITRRQSLVVVLASNPSTGYSWAVADVDATLLAQQGEAQYTPATSTQPRVGAGGTETFRFTAIGAGRLSLKLIYRRPWETDTAPLDTFTLDVTIS